MIDNDQAIAELSAQLAELQTQFAFQEDVIATLNNEVALLQREIEALNLRWNQAREQLESLSADVSPEAREAPPPHY